MVRQTDAARRRPMMLAFSQSQVSEQFVPLLRVSHLPSVCLTGCALFVYLRGSGEGWASALELRPMNRSF